MKNSTKRGFTIVELVVVIVVIAVLAAVLIPTFSGIIDRAKDSAAKQNAASAYTQWMTEHAADAGIPTMFIYVESGRYVTIDNGAVGDTVYTDEATAKKVLITNGTASNYTLEPLYGNGLNGLYLSSTLANFADPTINVSLSQNANEAQDKLDFALYHGTLSLGSVSVPQTAVASESDSVNVTVTAANPADTVEMGDHTKAYGYDISVSNLADGQSVSVALNAPSGLPDVKVYHSGEDITDSVTYDERSGVITFETDSFSPYIIAYEEYEVSTVEQLREAVAIDGAYIKLTADITANMNKSVDGNYCDKAHSWYSKSYTDNPECRFYFLMLVTGVNVSVDLNGHTIEVIDQLEDGYLYCMGVFTVDEGSNLNVLDSAGNGKIKLVGPMYAIWAPCPDSTSTDIYGGIFMSDSYVGDDYGWGYPYNNAIIYAGYDNTSVGSINIYGGYFLYNNFPNDDKNNNNGAFNVGDKATVPCIYVHDGVMLINQYWRQSTGTDDDSVFLADGCEVVQVTLDNPLVIDGVSYATWYQVQAIVPKFKAILNNTDTYMYRVGNSNAVKLGSLFKAVSPNSAINANANIDVSIEALDASTNVQGTYTAASSPADWANGTIKFTGTGVVKVTINGCELLLEVVNGYNVTQYSELKNANNILLNDIEIAEGKTFGVGANTLFGNGFTFDISNGSHAKSLQGVITISGGTIDNVRIIGDVFTQYVDSMSEEYYLSAVACPGGSATITNCYISGCHSAVRIAGSGGTMYIENSTLVGGRLSNLEITGGNVILKDVTTVNEKQTVDDTTVLGFGVLIYDYAVEATVTVEGTLTQYNWVCKDDKDYLPGAAANYVETAFGYTQFVYNYDGTDYVNLGILSISSSIASSSITAPDTHSVQTASMGFIVTYDNSKTENLLANGVPTYDGWSATAQGAYKPTLTWKYPSEYNSANGALAVTFESGNSYTVDPNFLTAKKHGITLPTTVMMDGVDYTGKTITFTESGEYTLVYTVTDAYNYDVNGTASSKTYTYTVKVVSTATDPEVGYTSFSYTDYGTGTLTTIDGKYYVMPNVSETSDTVTSTTVNGTTVYMPIVEARRYEQYSQYDLYSPAFSWITISDPNSTVYDVNTTEMPDEAYFGYVGSGATAPYYYGGSSNTIKTYGDYGLCYYAAKKNEAYTSKSQTVCFYYVDSQGRTYYYYVQYFFPESNNEGSCITPDTLITLADGTQKRVDQLTGNEMLLVWNMETGNLDSAPIMFIDFEEEKSVEIVHLYFSDGTDVKVIYEHGFWDYDLNRYVYLDENASDYIGHTFAKQNGDELCRVQLVDVVIENECTMAYSPVTAGHLCYFVNGMLSMPGGVGGLFNIFEVDAETMSYDMEALQRDIETYGLFTYEELNAICHLSEEMFEAAGGQYLKISIGKGNLTMDELVGMINRYSKFI